MPVATDIHEIDQAEPVGRGRRPGADPRLPLPPDRPGGRRRPGDRRGRRPAARQEGPVPGALGLPEHPRQGPGGRRRRPASSCASAASPSATTTWWSTCWASREMQELGAPVTIDATHAVQLPGADPRNGASTGGPARGRAGASPGPRWRPAPTGCSWSSIPIRTRRLCDGPSCLPLERRATDLLKQPLQGASTAPCAPLDRPADAPQTLSPWICPRLQQLLGARARRARRLRRRPDGRPLRLWRGHPGLARGADPGAGPHATSW